MEYSDENSRTEKGSHHQVSDLVVQYGMFKASITTTKSKEAIHVAQRLNNHTSRRIAAVRVENFCW